MFYAKNAHMAAPRIVYALRMNLSQHETQDNSALQACKEGTYTAHRGGLHEIQDKTATATRRKRHYKHGHQFATTRSLIFKASPKNEERKIK